MPSESIAPIRYRIRPSSPEAHLFRVSCEVPRPDPQGQILFMPAWIPGSYMIRDFARNVVTIVAESDGAAVAIERLDKNRWRCEPVAGSLRVSYEVYAWDLSVRSAHLDCRHGYFNGSSVFLQPCGHERAPCSVEILAPEGDDYHHWKVATTLPLNGARVWGFGSYRAANYDELIDHPVEMGAFTVATFQAGGVTHDIAISGRHRTDMERLCADLQRICDSHIRLFGALPPIDRYLFQVTAVGEGYGGLEHRSSTSLLCARDDLPRVGQGAIDDDYRRFLGLCSHEYFHTWNVKRIRPEVFTPYRLGREVHTRLLWVFEGITSYYDDLALRRSGLLSRQDYLLLLGQTATRVWRGQGRFRQTVSDSSFDAWTRFYKQDENAPNAIVSYYAKGALVALALDLTLREGSNGVVTLDDLMRALWVRYGKTGRGVPEDAVESLAAEISGLSLDEFFDQAVRGTDDLPLADLLARFGVRFKTRAADSEADPGGKPGKKPPGPVLGVRSKGSDSGVRLTHVLDNGAARDAGLAAGDLLVAVDGLRVDGDTLHKRLAALPEQRPVAVHAFRRDELMVFDVRLRPAPIDTVYLELESDCDSATAERRERWLGMD